MHPPSAPAVFFRLDVTPKTMQTLLEVGVGQWLEDTDAVSTCQEAGSERLPSALTKEQAQTLAALRAADA